MLKTFNLFLLFSLFTGCSILGLQDVPEPKYEVVLEEKSEGTIFQVRDYSELVVAETIVEVEDGDFDKAGTAGFRRLADYIFGKNQKEEKIEMTAPVLMNKEPEKKSWKMVFILPEEYTLEKAPAPKDQEVVIKKLKEKRFAVARFSGRFLEKNFNECMNKLSVWIKSNSYKPLSGPIFAGYNPPWTISAFRRNEVLIEISK